MIASSLENGLAGPWHVGVGSTFAFLVLVLAGGCGHGPPPAQAKKPIEVVVTTPITDEVTDYQDFTGRLDAFKTVDIRPRVSGYILEAPFKEGDEVHKGDLLFQIDPRPNQVEMKQAEANFQLAKADRGLQEKNAERARRLIGRNAIAVEEHDQILAALEKAVATVTVTEAARERAKIFLDFTHVISPLDGRISRRNVDPGNLVNADATVLTTVVSTNPIFAYFDVDERTYLDLMGTSSQGRSSWFTELAYPVLMRLANENEFSQAGTVNFLDNRLSGNTGTIRMRGVFQNPAGTLRPGLFVRIRLPLGTPYKAILISDETIMSDQGRKYVYVVNDKDEVEYRTVELGQSIQSLRVVKKGLAEGDRVILSGMQRVRPASKVQPTVEAPPKPPNSPLSKSLIFNRSRPAADKPAGAQ